MNTPLTPAEWQAEYDYIKDERLGMICEARVPTPEELARAIQETNSHMAKFTIAETDHS